METRAPCALVGLLVITTIFGFVYWFNNTDGLAKRTNYEIRFDKTVSGPVKGADVQFNGTRVGEVVDLKLNDDDPGMVTRYGRGNGRYAGAFRRQLIFLYTSQNC
ncbi:MAG: hypothetical protein WAM62_08645 [Pseudolabrys sp.]